MKELFELHQFSYDFLLKIFEEFKTNCLYLIFFILANYYN